MSFDTPINRTGTSSLKWDKYAGQDVLPLWVADMDLPRHLPCSIPCTHA